MRLERSNRGRTQQLASPWGEIWLGFPLFCVAAKTGALGGEAARLEERGASSHMRAVGERREEGADRDDKAFTKRQALGLDGLIRERGL